MYMRMGLEDVSSPVNDNAERLSAPVKRRSVWDGRIEIDLK